MLYITSHNIKEGRIGEYHAWVKKNKMKMQEHAPPGWKYLGTYGTVLGFGRRDVLDIWEIKDYSDFDTYRKWADPISHRLTAEQADFFMPGTGEATLARDVGDIVFIEPKKSKHAKR